MQTIGYAALQVIPSMKGATKYIDSELNGPMAGSGKKAGTSWGSSMTSSIGRYTKIATGLVAAFAAGKFIKGGWDRALNIDAARGKLKGLGHDAASVETIMDSALASVSGTAYGLDAAATTAAGAVAAGIKPGQELTKYLTLTADAASIAGVSMSEMGSIFGKVQTSQRAYTAELNQLADRGIPIYQWLQEEYGVTATELRKMVSSGKVDAETFYRVINENIGGAALASGDTIRGTIANVGAAFSRLGASVFTALLPAVKSAMDGIISGVDSLAARVGPAIDAASAWLTSSFVPAVSAVVGWLRGNLLPVLGTVAATLGGAVIGAIRTVGDALSGIQGDGSMAQTAFDMVATAVTTLADVMGTAITVAANVTAFLIEHRDVTVPLAAAILGIVAAYKAYKAVMAVITAAKAAYTAVVTTAAAVQQAYAMGTYGLIAGQTTLGTRIAAVTGFIAAKTAAMGAWIATQARAIAMNLRWQIMLAKQSLAPVIASLRTGVAAMGQWIAAQARAGAVAVASAARSAAGWVRSTAALVAHRAAMLAARTATAVMTAAQWAWNVALNANPIGLIVIAVAAFVAAIVLAWQNSETFRNVVTGALNAVLSAAQWLWEGIQAGFSIISTVVGTVVGLVQGYIGLWVAAFQWVIDMGQSLWSVIQSVMSAVGSVINTYVSAVRGYIGLWVGAFQSVMDKAAALGSSVSSAIGNVVSTITGLKDRVIGALSSAGDWLKGVGEDIMNGLVAGIERGFDWVKNKLSGVGKFIPGWLKSVLGIASPSRVMRDEIGRWLLPGIWAGVEQTEADFDRRMSEVVDGFIRTPTQPAVVPDTGDRSSTSVVDDASVDRIAEAVVEAAERIARGIVDGREWSDESKRSTPGVFR